ncbi:MAG: helix-turn-helix domain-containing protein [Prevotella sp.]|nr:helix-turn-helix domain-containing protein [Prevotella sp.]
MRYPQLDNNAVMAQVRELAEKKKVFRNRNLTSQGIADEIGISRSTLSTIINRELSMSFTEYISRLRLDYAHQLMQHNKDNLSLEQISFLSGFSCPSSFYRQHRKIYGTTPSVEMANKK